MISTNARVRRADKGRLWSHKIDSDVIVSAKMGIIALFFDGIVLSSAFAGLRRTTGGHIISMFDVLLVFRFLAGTSI